MISLYNIYICVPLISSRQKQISMLKVFQIGTPLFVSKIDVSRFMNLIVSRFFCQPCPGHSQTSQTKHTLDLCSHPESFQDIVPEFWNHHSLWGKKPDGDVNGLRFCWDVAVVPARHSPQAAFHLLPLDLLVSQKESLQLEFGFPDGLEVSARKLEQTSEWVGIVPPPLLARLYIYYINYLVYHAFLYFYV